MVLYTDPNIVARPHSFTFSSAALGGETLFFNSHKLAIYLHYMFNVRRPPLLFYIFLLLRAAEPPVLVNLMSKEKCPGEILSKSIETNEFSFFGSNKQHLN